jgi:pimeloyl-ACP methyl ester carboxylesterase
MARADPRRPGDRESAPGGFLLRWLGRTEPARPLPPPASRASLRWTPPGSLAPIPLGTWARMLAMLLGDEERYRSYLAWVRGGKLPESTTLDLLIASRREFVQAGTPRPQRIAPSEWAAFDSRVAVLLGGKSRFVPRRAEATLRRRAPESEVKRFPNASHALLVDEAEAITQYVNTFMRDRDAL